VTEVVTGEAVVLDVQCAAFPSRIGALLIDLVIQIVALAVVLIIAGSAGLSGAAAAGLVVTAYVAIVVGYATAFETLTRGRTPGKMAVGLRVISDDGSPVRFRQALVRALTGLIEIWSWIGAPIGLITSIISARGKRLGDVFAGTYVISERAPRRAALPPALAVVPPPLLGWAQVAETSRLSDQTAEAAGSYLRRLGELTPAARDSLGYQLAAAVAGQVSPPPPPGTPPAAYLAAVLAIRRQRDQAWLAHVRAAGPAGVPAPAAPGAAGLRTAGAGPAPWAPPPPGAASGQAAPGQAWAVPSQPPSAPGWSARGPAASPPAWGAPGSDEKAAAGRPSGWTPPGQTGPAPGPAPAPGLAAAPAARPAPGWPTAPGSAPAPRADSAPGGDAPGAAAPSAAVTPGSWPQPRQARPADEQPQPGPAGFAPPA
jgi:uncharacterized RDD family membrane protein YckC